MMTDEGPTRRKDSGLAGAVLTFVRLVLVAAAVPCVTGRLGSGILEALCSPWVFQFGLIFVFSTLVLAAVHAWRRTNPLVDLAVALPLAIWAGVVFVAPFRAGSTMVDASASASGPTIRVVLANLHYQGLPTPEAIAWFESIDADLLVLEELSPAWAEALSEIRDASASSAWHPESDASGIGVISRLPMTAVRMRPRERGAFPGIEATIDLGGRSVRLFAVHPIPPINRAAVAGRNAALAALAQEIAALDGGSAAVIVLGDLNETPWGSAMRSLLETSGLRTAREGFGRTPTWPARLRSSVNRVPRFLMIPIDHCLVSPEIRVTSFRTGPAVGSDHLPIVADLSLGGAANSDQQHDLSTRATQP